jgi:hypothetical protein
LLVFLLAAVFVALNLVGLRAWRQASDAQKAAIAAAQAQAEEQKAWLLAVEEIGGEFRSLPTPPALGEKGASSSLIDLVRSAAQANGLTILEESLPPAPEGLPEQAAGARVKLSGPFKGIVRMLFELQQPGQWRSVERLILKAEATPQNVLAELELRQYFTELKLEETSATPNSP